MDLAEFVVKSTIRGECKCGKCIDVGLHPDPEHAVNLVFFKVAKAGEPDAETFRRLTREHQGCFGPCDPLDGKEHNYLDLGGWIGDQGLAMQYMGLGALLGVFKLLTPYTMLRLPEGDELATQMAGMGMVAIQAPGEAREHMATEAKSE